MTLSTMVMAATLLASEPGVAAEVNWTDQGVFLAGKPFPVTMEIQAGDEGLALETWKLTAAAFEVDGKPLGERGDTTVDLAPGTQLNVSFDLGPFLGEPAADFQLGLAGGEARSIAVFEPVTMDFLKASPEDLATLNVLMVTNRGMIRMELWSDVAPEHVRNFTDLVASGFYDGTLFHRVTPTFMIQGGCPNTRERPNQPQAWGSGGGPRMVQAEFNDRNHDVGVLSAARTNDPNSHSSQFFIITSPSPHLNGQYSAFGKAIAGMDTVMSIARAPGQPLRIGGNQPFEPQRIEHAYVIKKQ